MKIDSYDAMIDANASLMEENYNNKQMTSADKMKSFSLGVRNQALINRALEIQRRECYRYGVKQKGKIRSLAFNPLDPDQVENVSKNEAE